MAFNFKKAQNATFTQKVRVPIANDKGGFDDQTFDGVFRRPDEEERKELSKLNDIEVCQRTLVGWDMKNEEGQAVEFSDGSMAAVLSIPPCPNYIAKAFWNGVTGGVLKN